MNDTGSSIFNEIDVYWIVLIVAGIFIFVSAIITIIVLCLLWRRYRKSTQLNIKSNEDTQIPVQVNDRPFQSYETQVCIERLLFFFF
jgi:uncharacterized membrane protein